MRCAAGRGVLTKHLCVPPMRRLQTRATRMNDNSSRSHAIVRLYIESRPLSSAGAGAQLGRRNSWATRRAASCNSKPSNALSCVAASQGWCVCPCLVHTAADSSSTPDMQPHAAAGLKQRTTLAVTTAAVNFVDLAGSERAAHSADTGEAEKLRAKEVRPCQQ